MIIIPSRKVIFIHLHKCGGTSVETAYEKVARYDDLILGGTVPGSVEQYYHTKFGLHKHSSIDNLIECMGRQTYDQMEVFCLVRNPFKIYQSFYSYIERTFEKAAQQHKRAVDWIRQQVDKGSIKIGFANWPISHAYARTETFEEFIEYFVKRNRPILLPMYDNLKLGNPELRPKHIYKIENIGDFWPAFSEAVGMIVAPERTNVSALREFYWSPGHIDFLYAKHGPEMEYFGYSYENR